MSFRFVYRLQVIALFLMVVLALFAVGCNAMGGSPTATPLGEGVDSPLKQSLLGKWGVNHGRFGNATFDFQENGQLTIENADTGESYNMSYIFVDEDTIAIAGYEEFAGTADIGFSGGRMDFTITFSGDVFGEIYPGFVRINDTD